MEFEGRKKVSTHLNIAPLIDIVFLLLIFFMLSSHFAAQPGIKITLPTAVTGKLQLEDEVLIFIASDDRLYLNEEEVTLGSLPDKLALKLEAAKKKTVVIKADEKVDLALAVKIMDVAKQAKAEGLIISTKAEEGAKEQSN